MKIDKKIIIELDETEVRQAVIDYIENHTDHRIECRECVTFLPANATTPAITAKVEAK